MQMEEKYFSELQCSTQRMLLLRKPQVLTLRGRSPPQLKIRGGGALTDCPTLLYIG